MFKKVFSATFSVLFLLLLLLSPQKPIMNIGLTCSANPNSIYKKIIELILPSKTKTVEQEKPSKFVYVSGYPLGFSIDGAGAVVVEKSAVITSEGYKMIANDNIMVGDIIKKINDEEVISGETIQEIVNRPENIGKAVKLTIVRNGQELEELLTAEYDKFASSYRLGLWVRDNAVGVGMMTMIDEEGNFSALGHPITDIDTGSILPVRKGRVYRCSIIGVNKGEKGTPGELKGLFLKTSSTVGSVDKNNNYGVFGKIDMADIASYSYKKLEIARDEEVKMGNAKIISTIDGVSPKEYDIEIIKTNYKSASGEKCMVIRITDEELISATGGIVQGMSGSPIIQNDKIIGCVTHVFVSDPKKGFANYISTMTE